MNGKFDVYHLNSMSVLAKLKSRGLKQLANVVSLINEYIRTRARNKFPDSIQYTQAC